MYVCHCVHGSIFPLHMGSNQHGEREKEHMSCIYEYYISSCQRPHRTRAAFMECYAL